LAVVPRWVLLARVPHKAKLPLQSFLFLPLTNPT
jgi:hypothetical protein